MRFLKIILSFLFITALTMPVLAATHQENSQEIKFIFNTKDLKELDSGDTVSVFYHLILANNTLATNAQTHKNANNLLETFFTKDLFKTYARVKKMDDNYFQAKGEEGCINFDAITGGQDVPYGFYIDADGKTKSKMATINVNLKYSNNAVIVLHLLKTESGWKIDDINYANKGSLRSKLQECLNNPKYSRYL